MMDELDGWVGELTADNEPGLSSSVVCLDGSGTYRRTSFGVGLWSQTGHEEQFTWGQIRARVGETRCVVVWPVVDAS